MLEIPRDHRDFSLGVKDGRIRLLPQGPATTTDHYQGREPGRFPSDSSHVSLFATNSARTHSLPEVFKLNPFRPPRPRGLSSPQEFDSKPERGDPRPARRAPGGLAQTRASLGTRRTWTLQGRGSGPAVGGARARGGAERRARSGLWAGLRARGGAAGEGAEPEQSGD